jgi:Tfp pilus assembly protein PilN
MTFINIVSLILKYKNISLYLLGLGILALLYFYIHYLRSTIEDQEQEILTLKSNITQYQSEISSKNTTITGINKTLQECYLVQKYKDEDLKQIEEIMNLKDEEGSKHVPQQQQNQITNKTYIEGIRFINKQYDSIK